MEFSALVEVIKNLISLDINVEEREFTLVLGPLTLRNVSYSRLKKDADLLEGVLSACFVQRRVMWKDYSKEDPDLCIRSLFDAKQRLERSCEEFPRLSCHRSPLRAWANACNKAAQTLQTALEEENAPENTGLDMNVAEWIPDTLRELRMASYPIIELFIELLRDDSEVKHQSREALGQGIEDSVVRGRLSLNALPHATVKDWQTEPKTP